MKPDQHSARLHALTWFLLAAQMVALCLLLLLLPGCGGSKSVVVPAQETAENWQSDTLRAAAVPELAPAGAGRVALPARVETHAPIPAPAPYDVTEVQLTRDTLTLRSPAVTRRFRAPAPGETLRVRREPGRAPAAGDTLDRIAGRVQGRPQPDTVQIQGEAAEKQSVFEKLASLPAWALMILVLVAAAVVLSVIRILPRYNP